MPPRLNPRPAHINRQDVVQLQRRDCHSTARGQALDLRPVFDPPEMIRLPLLPRVEDGRFLAGQALNALDLNPLIAVAQAAGQAEIALIISAAQGRRDDVVDFQSAKNEPLRTKAVAAALTARLTHALANVGRNIASTHDERGGINPRLTLSASASALSSNPS